MYKLCPVDPQKKLKIRHCETPTAQINYFIFFVGLWTYSNSNHLFLKSHSNVSAIVINNHQGEV